MEIPPRVGADRQVEIPPRVGADRQVEIPPRVESGSLLLRPTLESDVDALYAIQGDREAMVHTWWAPDRAAMVDRLAAYAARQAIDGFSPWTAVLCGSGEVVGWGGLNVDPFDPIWGPEVVYFIHRDHWGHGFATRIVAAALDLAFGTLGLPRVGAFARPENGASQRVLAKHGFRLVRYLPELERNHFVVDEETRIPCRS